MKTFATLCTLSLFIGIIFLILIVLCKIRKEVLKPLYLKGLKFSVIVFLISFVLVVVLVATDTSSKTKSESKKETQTIDTTPKTENKNSPPKNNTTNTQNNEPTDEERAKQFVEEVKTVIQGSVGENEQITGVDYKDRELRVSVNLSQATPDPLTYEDLAISRTSSITDQILTLTGYFNLWDTITIDFGDIGYIKNSKQNIANSGYGFYFDSANFQLEQ